VYFNENEVHFFTRPQPTIQVPTQLLFPLIFLPPIAVALIAQIWMVPRFGLQDIHHFMVGFLGVVASMFWALQLTRSSRGKFRPTFFVECEINPLFNSSLRVFNDPSGFDNGKRPAGLEDVPFCLNNDDLENERWSFVSGHGALLWGSGLYTCFYIMGKNPWFIPKRASPTISYVFCLAFLSVAHWVGLTRIVDFRHHEVDVAWGPIVCIFVSIFWYFFYFPAPWSLYGSGIPKGREGGENLPWWRIMLMLPDKDENPAFMESPPKGSNGVLSANL